MNDWKLTCRDCACHDCSQRENCASCGCDGGGCTRDDLEYFRADCDDYEVGWE
jgi:hypothetical protein